MIAPAVWAAARVAVLAALLALGPAGQGACAETVPEPEGYRMAEYRAPVPATLAGATVLDTEGAQAMWQEGRAVFVDVLPRPPKPANLAPGTIWQAPARDTIPGATWLPNTGFGALAPETEAWFRGNLDRLTGGDPDRPVVFFCLADCWMSWNAARRAVLEYRLGAVYWYPFGTDGWEAAGLPLEKVRAAE
jgi:PQQ-dependent catabolism-associated CXXCW motif protein